MSAREGLAALLAGHVDVGGMLREDGGYDKYVCLCGEAGGSDHEWHRAHLAHHILTDWLPGALADERVVEAARMAVCRTGGDPDMGNGYHRAEFEAAVATAALTAAVRALREEPEHG